MSWHCACDPQQREILKTVTVNSDAFWLAKLLRVTDPRSAKIAHYRHFIGRKNGCSVR